MLEFEYLGYVCTATKVDFKAKDNVRFPNGIKVITDDDYMTMWKEKWEREQESPVGN